MTRNIAGGSATVLYNCTFPPQELTRLSQEAWGYGRLGGRGDGVRHLGDRLVGRAGVL